MRSSLSSGRSLLVVTALLTGACTAPSTSTDEEIGSSRQALVSSPKQVVYIPLWGTVDNSKIPWADITHINLAFAGINSSHQCAWVDANGNASGYDNNARTVINYKNANYPAIKVLVSVGGWTMSHYFSESATSTYRAGFVSSCLSLVNNIGADGIDLDWEYPTSLGAGNCPAGHTCQSSSDPANYTATLTSLRSSFGSKLITAALRGNTAGNATIPYEYGNFFSGSPKRFDFVNLMTYDYHGTWESVTGFTAPYSSVTQAMDYARSQVTDTYKDRVVMGIPFYGHAWANVASPSGAGTGYAGTPLGTVSYKDALALAGNGACTVKTPTSGDTQNRYIYCGSAVNVTYVDANSGNLVTASKSGLWVAYDNTTVVGTKGTYVANNNYGGMMWWAQGNDSASNDLANTIDSKLTAPAGAPISGHTYKVVGKQSNKCVDVPGGSMSTGVFLDLWTCNGGTNQSYLLTDVGGGQYTLKNTKSGLCWDIPGGSMTAGTKIEQWTCGGGTNQKFTLASAGAGYYTIKNVKSGLCTDIAGNNQADGAIVEQWTCSGGSNQAFQFQ